MSCRCDHVCRACAEKQALAFKRKYCITPRIERQIVAMSDSVPPHPGEGPVEWLERLYRAWYAANQ